MQKEDDNKFKVEKLFEGENKLYSPFETATGELFVVS